MKTILENNSLLIETADAGAELCRIFDKHKQREVLWTADPAYWNRHSPILFPMVGQSYHKEYRVNGKTYAMTSHGFARDMSFKLLSHTENEIWYVLESTEDTLAQYPFPFRLEAGFRLEASSVHVMWKLRNTGSSTMYFGLGAHPAFLLPDGCPLTDIRVSFGAGKTALSYLFIESPGSGCAVPDRRYTLPLDNGITQINSTFFDHDAYIFEDSSVDQATILTPDGLPYITVACAGFPEFGLWSKPGAPFLCLEPWYGRCDNTGFTGELKDKDKVRSLEPNSLFEAAYDIIIHEC